MAIVISGVNNNDKITASDGTIDLLSGVSYAGIITAPAFTTPGNITASGNLTAGHLNIGSGIQLGNAGVATATTFVGNLTGNVNATSNLLLQIGGSEKFRVGSSGQLGIAGANYGTSGQVLTSGGSGSAATWSTITGTTINSNGANRIITGSGSANTLEGNSNFTYTGSTVTHNNPSGLAKLDVKGSVGGGALGASISVRNTNSANNGSGEFQFQDPGSNIFAKIAGTNLTDGSNNGYMSFHTASSTSGLVERVQIKDGGGLVSSKGGTLPFSDGYSALEARAPEGTTQLTVTNTTYESGTFDNEAGIWFKGNYSGNNERAKSAIIHKNTGDYGVGDLNFCLDGTGDNANVSVSDVKMKITSAGKVGINSTTPQQALDVRGSINGGSVNQPFLRFHDSHGNQRTTKHYFRCTKGGTSTFDILTVDLNTNFHQALIILYYGARIQGVADSVTYPVNKVMGVNRFNGGSVQFNKITAMQDSNAANHADIDVVATSSTQYRIRLTFSGTAGGSSFAAGYVEIIGLGPGTDGAFYSLAHGYGITR